MPGHPIGLGDVKRTAGRIQRRRRVAAGAVVAAAAAIVVPTVMVAGNLLGGDAAPQPANPGPSVTETPEPAPVDGPIVLDADVPQGADPRLAYLAGRELIDSAGNRIRLDADYNMIARAGDEYLAVRQGDLGVFVDVLDAEGAVIETSRTTGEVVSSADLTVAAWAHPDGRILTRSQGKTAALDSVDRPLHVAEVIGSGTCQEGTDGSGCLVYSNEEGTAPPVSTSSHGITDVFAGGFQTVRAVSPERLVAGLVTEPNPDPAAPACSAVYDLKAGKQLFRTCDYVFEYAGSGFSPDASNIVAYPQDADGAGPRSIVVLDARSGEAVTEIEVAGANTPRAAGSIVDTTWEDGGHLLVKVEGMNADGIPAYTMFRVGVDDGTAERVLQPDTTGGEVQPWVFID